ncbi:MAG: MerC domain-containing protein [Bacteroidia bacterium]|nr:MerC domain-containing protein [Bacteroidia bacterium]
MQSTPSILPPTAADTLGAGSALLCLVHCIVAPIYLGAGAHLQSLEPESLTPFWLHEGWDFVFLGIGLIAVWFSSRHTHRRSLRYLMWGSYAALVMAIVFEAYEGWFSSLVYVASVSLIVSHLLSFRRRHA